MSEYSVDSLESLSECSPRETIVRNDKSVTNNLKAIKSSNEHSKNLPFYLNPTSTLSTKTRNTRSNETAPSMGTDRDTGTAGSRNAIIANSESVDASKRRHPASLRNENRKIPERLTDEKNKIRTIEEKERSASNRLVSKCIERSSKTPSSRRSHRSGENSTPMKPDKKLGNVLAPRIQQARKPRSYLELYRRRFSVPRYRIQSPEGSTLSICGDSQHEHLTEDSASLPATPRDVGSEFSFYRQLIERSNDSAHRAVRSSESLQQRPSIDSYSFQCSTVKSKGINDKPKERLGYRPYTIEEYRTLPVPKLDRSLGPDKIEIQAKREWLMRRRSYGNSVSARNRQQVLLQTQKIKSRRGGAQKCFLPPLKNHEIDGKQTEENLVKPPTSDRQNTSRKSNSIHPDGCFKRSINLRKVCTSKKSKKIERISSFCSSLNSYDIVEDSYLETLRERHLHEKEMVDRLIKEALRQ